MSYFTTAQIEKATQRELIAYCREHQIARYTTALREGKTAGLRQHIIAEGFCSDASTVEQIEALAASIEKELAKVDAMLASDIAYDPQPEAVNPPGHVDRQVQSGTIVVPVEDITLEQLEKDEAKYAAILAKPEVAPEAIATTPGEQLAELVCSLVVLVLYWAIATTTNLTIAIAPHAWAVLKSLWRVTRQYWGTWAPVLAPPSVEEVVWTMIPKL